MGPAAEGPDHGEASVMDTLRVAAIGRTGRGDRGHAIDELWKELPGVAVVAVADESPEGLAKATERHGLDAKAGFADWRRMLAEVKPDIVAICMRHVDCHAEMALAAAEAGVRGIFMEKPFVRTLAEADAVIAACRRSGTKLSVAFVNRHSPTYGAVRELVETGRIGKVLELRGRGKEDRRGGGEDMWVLGAHVFDLMADLAGGPRWCSAVVTQTGRGIGKDDAIDGPEGLGLIAGDSIAAMFGMADGPTAYFASTREAGLKQPNFGLTIAGTNGAIQIWPDRLPHAYFRAAPLWRVDRDVPWQPIGPEGIEEEAPSGVDRSVERAGWGRRAAFDLVDAILTDREPETGMYAGRTSVEMTAAVYASALSGRRIDLPLADRSNPLA
jgi:predicted dehydrogenase